MLVNMSEKQSLIRESKNMSLTSVLGVWQKNNPALCFSINSIKSSIIPSIHDTSYLEEDTNLTMLVCELCNAYVFLKAATLRLSSIMVTWCTVVFSAKLSLEESLA